MSSCPVPKFLISAVIEHADLRDDMGGGKVLLRVSPFMALAVDMPERHELPKVAVLYDEVDDEVVRVLTAGGSFAP